MEPPAKRQRLWLGPTRPEDEDELDFDPEELNQMRDPAYQLEQARDHAMNKLKSRFENIFAKYEKDFTGVADEIDLRTGQVVVDNGHLQSMLGVDDTSDGEEVDQDEEERIMHGRKVTGSTTSEPVTRRGPWEGEGPNLNAWRHSPMMGGPPRLSSMMNPSRNSLMTPPRSIDSFDSAATLSVDPSWQCPDLPRSAYLGSRSGVSGRQYSYGLGASTRKLTRKALPGPREQEDEDEDVLLGESGNALRQNEPAKGSPLIKKISLTVDSSPINEPGLKELIQEVIENIPETPPSVQRPMASKPGTKRQSSGTRKPLQPNAQSKGKPQGRGADESSKGEPTGVHLDISQKVKAASLAGSPTGSIKARRNTESLAGRAGTVTHANKPGKEISSFHERDLVSFQDVTAMPARILARQALYVEIEARSIAKNGYMTAQPGVGEDALESRRHNSKVVTAIGPGKQVPELLTAKGIIERNHIDPAFIFSDEETLPPRKTRNSRRKSEPATVAAPGMPQASQSRLQQRPHLKDQFERNVVDPSYAFSDEEKLLPRRRKMAQRKPEPAVSAKLSTREDLSASRESEEGPVSKPREMLHSQTEHKRTRRSMRSTLKPAVTADMPVDGTDGSLSSNALPAESELQGILSSADEDALRPRTSRQQEIRSTSASVSVQNKPRVGQETPRATPGSHPTHPGTVCRDCRTSPSRKCIALPELGDSTALAAGPAAEGVGGEGPKRGSLPTAESAPLQQPSTPQSRSRAPDKKTPSSRAGLISLLSDNEDEEDEISFDLSAFTPSGQHRILVHRPYPHLTAPRRGSDSTAGRRKKGAGSLLFGPSSTSKARKHRTPGSEGQAGEGKRRGSTNSLARSVVRARRESAGAQGPVGSVVQTPGGTKRTCGKDGYRCGRDFCFICISI